MAGATASGEWQRPQGAASDAAGAGRTSTKEAAAAMSGAYILVFVRFLTE
jgi:hypothetical protein